MLKNIITSAAVALASLGMASAAIDFEDVAGLQGSSLIQSGGYDWNFSASGWFIGDPSFAFYPDGTTNGTNILAAAGDNLGQTARVTMTLTGGGTFDLFNLDAASSNTGLANSIEIEGSLLGGGTVTTTIAVGGSFANYNLVGFTDLVSVVFSSVNSGGYNMAGFALDNLNGLDGAAVPVPAALPLMLLGMGAIGATRRARKAA